MDKRGGTQNLELLARIPGMGARNVVTLRGVQAQTFILNVSSPISDRKSFPIEVLVSLRYQCGSVYQSS